MQTYPPTPALGTHCRACATADRPAALALSPVKPRTGTTGPAGASWAGIGGTPGLSRQATFKRVGPAINLFTGETTTATATVPRRHAISCPEVRSPRLGSRARTVRRIRTHRGLASCRSKGRPPAHTYRPGIEKQRHRNHRREAPASSARPARSWRGSRSTATVRRSGCCCRWMPPNARSGAA